MKRIGILFIAIILVYSVYNDLTVGILPGSTTQTKVVKQFEGGQDKQALPPSEENKQYQEVIVEPGYTVLSIVEHLHEGPIPVSIDEVIYNFKQLNPSIEPDSLQIGQSYLFPLYYSE